MANRGPNAVGVETRRKLLDAGISAFHSHGFHATGVDVIARAASVPKGSFYNHFSSKQSFGAEVVDCYFERHLIKLEEFLANRKVSPRKRLEAYFDERIKFFKALGCKRGCLMGNLGLELADHEESVRQRLAERFGQWSAMFSACIEQAQERGEIRSTMEPDALADFILNSWEGALLRMKVERSVAPLERARNVILQSLLV